MSNEQNSSRKRWWVSWYGTKVPFEYHGPWWVSGICGDVDATPTIVAAVVADTEDGARAVVERAHESRVALVWRFVLPRAYHWQPYCDRFPRGSWMHWPYTAPGEHGEARS